MEQSVALWARIVFGAADGRSDYALAGELGTSRPTVLEWRQRFAAGGIKALYDDQPRGRDFKSLPRAKEVEIIARTQIAPTQTTQWSCSRMAGLCGVSAARVARQRLEAAFAEDLQAIQHP